MSSCLSRVCIGILGGSTLRDKLLLVIGESFFIAILTAYFVFYLLSFSIPECSGGKKIEVGDDSEYTAMIEGPLVPTADFLDVKKHPLFPLIATPLYRLGECLFAKSPCQKALSRVFPFALMGWINLIISYQIFLRVFGKEGYGCFPKLLTLLYGSCFSFWVFSSNVETYMVTTLFQNLLWWRCMVGLDREQNVFLTGLLLGLCVLASTAMVWMFIPAGMLLARNHDGIKTAFWRIIKLVFAAGLTIGAVYIFYDMYYQQHQIPTEKIFGSDGFSPSAMMVFFARYLETWVRWDLKYVYTSLRAFFVDSLGYPILHTNVVSLGMFWAVFAVFLTVSLTGLWRSRAAWPSLLKACLVFEVIYAAFFCFFSPETSILYSLPALLPFLVCLSFGLSFLKARPLKYLLPLALLCVVVLSNVGNYFQIIKINEFMIKRHQYYWISQNPLLSRFY